MRIYEGLNERKKNKAVKITEQTKMVEHLIPSHIAEIIDTQYGEVTYLHYCYLEKKRIENDPTRTARIEVEGEICSLLVNDITI